MWAEEYARVYAHKSQAVQDEAQSDQTRQYQLIGMNV
jgi:hypothetical protein